jgi:hypothetical protein
MSWSVLRSAILLVTDAALSEKVASNRFASLTAAPVPAASRR